MRRRDSRWLHDWLKSHASVFSSEERLNVERALVLIRRVAEASRRARSLAGTVRALRALMAEGSRLVRLASPAMSSASWDEAVAAWEDSAERAARSQKKRSPRAVTFTNGSAIIEGVRIIVDEPDLCVIEIDMTTKWTEIAGLGDFRAASELFLMAGENSLYGNPDERGAARVTVSGLGSGFTSIAEGGRYTARACWYRSRVR